MKVIEIGKGKNFHSCWEKNGHRWTSDFEYSCDSQNGFKSFTYQGVDYEYDEDTNRYYYLTESNNLRPEMDGAMVRSRIGKARYMEIYEQLLEYLGMNEEDTEETTEETETEEQAETTEPETDEFNLTPEQTEKLISDYDDFMRQMESLKEKEEPEATEEPTAEKQITSEELGTDDTTEETKTENVDWGYFDKFDEISGIYLPPTGEGETKATQLVTAISKLVYKWYNDGDVYDNTAYMEGWCNDLSSYANWIYANYLESQPILDRIYKVYDDAGYEHILKDLADKFLNKEFLSVENKKNSYGSIYNADGNFRFDDYETENDDDYEW